jgi:Mg2+-importing ATPase
MLFMGPTSSIFDIVTFLVMFYVMGWNNNGYVGLFQTGWFLESLLTQSAVIIILRSNKFPFHNTYPSLPVVLSLALTLLIGFMLVLTPGLEIFTPLSTPESAKVIGYIIAIVCGYIVTAQLAKVLYIKIFRSWL